MQPHLLRCLHQHMAGKVRAVLLDLVSWMGCCMSSTHGLQCINIELLVTSVPFVCRERTCPMCRTLVRAAGTMSSTDGATSLLPLVF